MSPSAIKAIIVCTTCIITPHTNQNPHSQTQDKLILPSVHAEQLRLKHDHEELKDRVTKAEQKDRVASRACQDQVAKLGSGQQKLQQDTAAMAEALADLIRRKSPSVLWQVSHEAVSLCRLYSGSCIWM